MSIKTWHILFFLGFLNLQAQDSLVEYKPASSEILQSLSADADLEYSLSLPLEKSPLSQILGQKFHEILARFLLGLGSDTGRAFIYLLGSALILYLLFRLLGPDRIGLASNREMKEASAEYKDWQKSRESLESLLLRAEQYSDWREFIRLQFLLGLKHLHEAGELELSPKKTALDYHYEIRDRQLAQSFLQFSRTFEYVWYGGFEADENRARQYRREANKLQKR